MSATKHEAGVIAPGSDLLTDLLVAVAEQRAEDGTCRTPYDSAAERRRTLTDRWSGVMVTAQVVEGSLAALVIHGDYKDDSHGNLELVCHREIEGQVEIVSPAYGGYIELADKRCIALPTLADGAKLIPANKLGLDLEVRTQN